MKKLKGRSNTLHLFGLLQSQSAVQSEGVYISQGAPCCLYWGLVGIAVSMSVKPIPPDFLHNHHDSACLLRGSNSTEEEMGSKKLRVLCGLVLCRVTASVMSS